jgi:hypothetical protein
MTTTPSHPIGHAGPGAAEHPPELRHFGWLILGLHAPLVVFRAAGAAEADRRAREIGGELVPIYRWAHVAQRAAPPAPAAACASCALHAGGAD